MAIERWSRGIPHHIGWRELKVPASNLVAGSFWGKNDYYGLSGWCLPDISLRIKLAIIKESTAEVVFVFLMCNEGWRTIPFLKKFPLNLSKM